MSQDEQGRSRDAPPEPISPELALVDPDAARDARDTLQVSDSIFSLTRARAQEVRAEPSTEPSVRDRLVAAGADRELLTAEPTPSERPYPAVAMGPPYAVAPARSRRRGFLAIMVTVLATLAGMAALSVVPLSARSNGVEANTLAAAVGVATDRPAGKVPAGETKRAKSGAPPSPRSPRRGATTSKPRKAARRVVPPTRTFIWPTVPKARTYRVEFFRRGRKVFEASPPTARLELPLRWTYNGRRFRVTRGTYRWQVRAIFGRSSTRLGKLVTSSTWIVR